MDVLVSIQQSIAERVSATLTAHSDWPCRAGCDDCCRNLAAVPEITSAEWELLREGIATLTADVQDDIQSRLLLLEGQSRPFTCPLLDLDTGRCRTYEQRPIACRTYGFYVERGEGLYCSEIQTRADSGELDDVVWGNQATIEERSTALGPTRSLSEWLKLR